MATLISRLYALSLHDALPIWLSLPLPRWPDLSYANRFQNTKSAGQRRFSVLSGVADQFVRPHRTRFSPGGRRDRKSTRLNSSHVAISYAVFCLKKKKQSHKIN